MKCTCDFCSGRKSRDDNWCARCGLVRMEPPKWWENLDVCDECEVATLSEEYPHVSHWRPYEPCKEEA